MRQCCLLDLPKGQTARISHMDTSGRDLARLCSLGFTPGAEVTLCSANQGGCRVQVRDTCLVLTDDVARDVFCSFSPENEVCSGYMPGFHTEGRDEECLSI